MAFLTVARPFQILTQIAAGSNAIAAGTCTEVSYTVTGLDTPMTVIVTGNGLTANLGIVNAYVSAANTLKVRFCNPTAGSLNTAGNLNVIAL